MTAKHNWFATVSLIVGMAAIGNAQVPDRQAAADPLLDQLLQDSPADNAARSRERVPDGEDLGAASPLLRVAHDMAYVQQRLQQQDSSEGMRQVQERIVRALESMIEEADQQDRQNETARTQQNSRAPVSQPQRTAGSRPSGVGRSPSNIAEQQRQMNEWISRVWGHLPDRVREQIQNPLHEEFLPSYRKLISDYYEHLAK